MNSGAVSFSKQKEKKKEAQQAMVKESLTRAFNELNSGNVHHDARRLFKD